MPELSDMKREKAEQERKVKSATFRHASAKNANEREKEAETESGEAFVADLNILIFSWVALGFRRWATIVRNGERRAIYRACRSFELTRNSEGKRDSRLFLVETWRWCRARHLRKRSFRINSLADYRYRLLEPCFSSACNTGLIRSARNRRICCISITMLTKFEYYSSIDLPIVKSAWLMGSHLFAHNCFQIAIWWNYPRDRGKVHSEDIAACIID